MGSEFWGVKLAKIQATPASGRAQPRGADIPLGRAALKGGGGSEGGRGRDAGGRGRRCGDRSAAQGAGCVSLMSWRPCLTTTALDI